MTPLLSIIGSAIRRVINNLVGDIGTYADTYWNNVVLLIRGNKPSDAFSANVSLLHHADDYDSNWGSTVLALHMGDGKDVDLYWENVVLSMPMNGPNNSTAFGDRTGKVVTAYGNAAISTTQSKFGGSSAYFDGTGDYLTVPTSTAWDFTGDFTVEFWAMPSLSGTTCPVSLRNTSLNYWSIMVSTTEVYFYYWDASSTYHEPIALAAQSFGGVIAHYAFTRSGSNFYFFRNGLLLATGTNAAAIRTSSSAPLTIGASGAATPYYYKGYIDDLRITKGYARYTSKFDPPTRANPAGPNTIYDERGNLVTAYGNAALSSNEWRFGGKSCYFDGTGDYLSVPASADLVFSSSSFTVEGWVNPAVNNRIICANTQAGSDTTWQFQINASSHLQFHTYVTILVTSTATIPLNSWTHVAVTFDGTTYRLFINGTLDGTGTTLKTFSTSVAVCVGTNNTLSSYYQGYIDDLRITKGVARYTASFTPPARAFPHGSLTDETGKAVTVSGTPTISATAAKFGTSIALNGTTDYLTHVIDAAYGLDTGDFTLEAWIKTSAAGTFVDLRNFASDYGVFYINASGYLAVTGPNGELASTATVTSGAWKFIAITRYNNVLTFYVDGIVAGFYPYALNLGAYRPARIGADYAAANFLTGSIDELRLTKGVCRYSGEFTPPAHQFNTTDSYPIFEDETALNAITVYGNARTDSTTYQYGNGALRFDGTGDYLSLGASIPSYMQIGSSDFTIEFWVKTLSTSTQLICGNLQDTTGYGHYWVVLNSTYTGLHTIQFGVQGVTYKFGTTALSTSVWNHVAIVRYGTTLTAFINGAVYGTPLTINNFSGTIASEYRIGAAQDGVFYYFNGYLDDLRITKGVARYNATFTPPAREFSNYGQPVNYDPYWSSVVLGMYMDGADNGVVFTDIKGKTISNVGSPVTKTATKKFGTASAFLSSANHVRAADSTDFDFGTGDFTVESWINPSSLASYAVMCARGAGGSTGFFVQVSTTGALQYGVTTATGAAPTIASSTGAVAVGNWHHVAVSKSSGTTTLYLNGTSVGQTSNAASLSASGYPILIGVTRDLVTGAAIYIDDLRITKGVARYTSNFVPYQYAFPEIPPPQTSLVDPYYDDVVLNMHMNGPNASTAFVDEKGKTVTAYGNASISTTQSKFGGSSAYFDGTGDYLTLASSANYTIITGDFCVEFWTRFPTSAGNQAFIEFYTDTNNSWNISLLANISFYSLVGGTGSAKITATAPSNDVWHHIALAKSGTTFTLYVDGSSVGPSTTTSYHTGTCSLYVGSGQAGSPFTGYIQDLRITKGYARYTTNFNPPQRANPDYKTLPAVTDPYWKNVVLHMPMNGADGGTTFTENTGKAITVAGNTSTQVEQYRFGGSSAYFDGTGDYLTTYIPEMGAGNFTIEFWVNLGSIAPTWQGLVDQRSVAGSVVPVLTMSAGSVVFYVSASARITSSALTVSKWYHVALVKNGSTSNLYINGEISGSTYTDNNTYLSGATAKIGALYDGSNTLNGYIDDLRITKGVARYTGNFTPPSLPNPIGYDPYASSVSLLLKMDGVNGSTTITDETVKTITVAGNAALSTKNSALVGTGSSCYFDGTGDYLSCPYSSGLDFGTGDFTIECWVYLSATQVQYAGIACQVGTTAANWFLSFGTGNTLKFTNYATTYVTSSALSNNTWIHVAAVRVGTSMAIYLNGISAGTGTYSGTLGGGNSITIGGNSTYYFNGYIDDLRITNGVARYTAAFTPHKETLQLA